MAMQKQWIRRLAVAALAAVIAFGAILAAQPTAAKAAWVRENGAYYYRNDNGTLAKNAWIKYNGAYYYVGKDGKAVANTWVKYNGAYYYIGKEGKALANSWVKYNGAYYYVGKDGKAVANTWVKYNDTYYYIGKEGKALADTWVNYKGSWYYLYETGEVVVNDFIMYKGSYYYFGEDGKLAVSKLIEYWGAHYYAGKDGKLITDKFVQYGGDWYYFDASGWLVTDWSVLYNGTIYYFGPDGKLVSTQPAGDAATVEPQVILDTASFKITVTGLMGYMVGEGPELYLTIENKTEVMHELHIEEVCVNGWQLNYGVTIDAYPGTTESSIVFDRKNLEKCGITQLAQIEFRFSVFNPETEEDIYTRDHVEIQTSVAETYVQEYDESGTVVCDQDGLKVVVKGYAENEFGDKGISVYVHNTTGHYVSVNFANTQVNGIDVDPLTFVACMDGKHALGDMMILSFDLEELGITDIHQIVTAFEIRDYYTYELYGTTPVVTLNF